MRIAIGGFLHETNTFSSVKTTYNDFVLADSWPKMLYGSEIIKGMRNKAIPIAGFIAEALESEVELFPLIWCSASPSGTVLQSAFEQIKNEIVQGLKGLKNVEAIYLDLHGAMVSEELEDTEGDLLMSIRQYFPNTPIVINVDFHANISKKMVELTDQIIGYKTYPHVDMYQVGKQAFRALQRIENAQKPPFKAFKRLPFLVPMTAQSTLSEPCLSLFQKIAEYEQAHDVSIVMTLGFPLADVREVGPALIVYASNQKEALLALTKWTQYFLEQEKVFQSTFFSAKKAVEMAKNATVRDKIILVDTQDNPGCGASSDATGLLQSMIERSLSQSVLGLLCDPESVLLAYQAGVGKKVSLSLGAKVFTDGCDPIKGKFKVLQLSDGKFKATGPFYYNMEMDLGLMALLEINGVHVVISSQKAQAADQEMFLHLGVDFNDYCVIALKSSVHYQAHFNAISKRHIIVESPGFNIADIKKLNYRNKPKDVWCV